MDTVTEYAAALDKQSKRIRHLVDRLNEILGLPQMGMDQKAEGWNFGYIGNCSGTPGTPAFEDDRMWTVWAPHPGRPGRSHENLGYVRTGELDQLIPRLVGVIHYLRATGR